VADVNIPQPMDVAGECLLYAELILADSVLSAYADKEELNLAPKLPYRS
jgi:hypothetical protein